MGPPVSDPGEGGGVHDGIGAIIPSGGKGDPYIWVRDVVS